MSRNGSPPIAFLKHLDSFLGKFLGGFLPEERRYWVLVPVIGVISGLLAIALGKILHFVELVAWSNGGRILDSAARMAADSPIKVLLVLGSGGGIASAALYLRKRESRSRERRQSSRRSRSGKAGCQS